mmetsp:Transcript_126272/g.365531  ORF Transcript_126272/g.365531 Transcript_126272/m.365531 type:complete len:289 (-) Transcript_126272:390-1256(-)
MARRLRTAASAAPTSSASCTPAKSPRVAAPPAARLRQHSAGRALRRKESNNRRQRSGVLPATSPAADSASVATARAKAMAATYGSRRRPGAPAPHAAWLGASAAPAWPPWRRRAAGAPGSGRREMPRRHKRTPWRRFGTVGSRIPRPVGSSAPLRKGDNRGLPACCQASPSSRAPHAPRGRARPRAPATRMAEARPEPRVTPRRGKRRGAAPAPDARRISVCSGHGRRRGAWRSPRVARRSSPRPRPCHFPATWAGHTRRPEGRLPSPNGPSAARRIPDLRGASCRRQ